MKKIKQLSKNPIQPTKWWQLIWYTIINQPPKKHEFNWWQTVEMHGLTIECAHTHKKISGVAKQTRTHITSFFINARFYKHAASHTHADKRYGINRFSTFACWLLPRKTALAHDGSAAASPPQSSRDNLAFSLSRGIVVCQSNQESSEYALS